MRRASTIVAVVLRVSSIAMIAIVAMLSISLQQVRAEDDWEVEGGKGDQSQVVRCPAGEYLIGLYGHTGLWVDQIGLTCGRFAQPAYNVISMHRLPTLGGNGGGPNVQDCAVDSAIRGIEISVIVDEEGVNPKSHAKEVAGIRIHCLRPVDGSSAGDLTFGGTYKGGSTNVFNRGTWVAAPSVQTCTGNQYATGLAIRFGQYVNAVGLICDSFAARAASTESPPPEPVLAGMEDGTDRPGSDYKSWLGARDPDACRQACFAEHDKCRAWTYVRRGFLPQKDILGPTSGCYMKSSAPAPVHNPCCVSGLGGHGIDVRVPAGSIPHIDLSGQERDTDRPGADYAQGNATSPLSCQQSCVQEGGKCRAWTWVKPGIQGPNAHCYMKSSAPPPASNTCCVSGTN